ncbi:sugar ABC transporter permease [Tessaracoccus rhinocerotis]|uniref:Sugar ABC transporter permease n=2 Tax=Tessaracoccus rhinocerotis TaxID=1689449 RepID=A0A553JZQ4_9ACTN|nr:sugar ABC transporter permease [Tessaracoccus rhinocerotis]
MAVFLGVPLIIYLGLVIYPFIQAVHYSFTNWRGFEPISQADYVWFDNYIYLFNDPKFMQALGNNILLAIFLPLITIILALVLAIVITMGGPSHGNVRGIKGAGFYRVVSFFPYVIPGIVIGFMWRLLLDPSAGFVNGILTAIGLEQFENFAWLGDARTAMPVSMFVIIWGFVGFYMLLFIAAIKAVPAEIYEAVRIDGAGRFVTAVRVTVPLIRDNIQTAYIYMGIMAMDAFIYMSALNPRGGPQFTTLVMSQELFNTAFGGNNLWGRASAMGVVLAGVTLAFAAVVFLVNRLTGGKDTVKY